MGKPPAPEPAEVTPAGPRTFRITWEIPDEDPEITASTIRMRIQGSQKWQSYDHSTGSLVAKGGATVPAPSDGSRTCEVNVENVEEGICYEAVIAMMNSVGWGDVSAPSKPACIGEPKPRAKPSRPLPPMLEAVGPGKMKCKWDFPEACPPVEASQLQLTNVSRNTTSLIDAANGKLVPSGRTTFAAPRHEANINGVEDGDEYTVAVCCRNAEGFGEYSQPSDSAVVVDASKQQSNASMALVISTGPSEGGAPVLEPLPSGQGKIRVLWIRPEDAKSTLVKIRKVGDQNWYVVKGDKGNPVAAPDFEMVASGLEEGIEYEAMISFLMGGRWGPDSPVSKPNCIGEKKLPAIPGIPKEPMLKVLDQSRMQVSWKLETTVPSVTGVAVRFRPLGVRLWLVVDPKTGQLVVETVDEPELVPATTNRVIVENLQAGIRYEASVAFKNKLGLGRYSPTSDIACIGRLMPNYLSCMNCNYDYDLQHTRYNGPIQNFWCPVCRFRYMDPFNAVMEHEWVLLCHIVTRPTISFSLDLPDLKSWRKEDESVFMRMIKVDSETTTQVWPKSLIFEANGHEVFKILEPEEGHVRRDVPMNIAAGLRPGMNQIKITIEDENASSYSISLVRTLTRTVEQISQEIEVSTEEECRERVLSLLAPNWATIEQMDQAENNAKLMEEQRPVEGQKNGEFPLIGPQPMMEGEQGDQQVDWMAADMNGGVNGDFGFIEDDITCLISNKLKLRCPLSFERVSIPVRGKDCMHLHCFGLGAYLESNFKMRAHNNRWTCPVCGGVLKPQDLRVDGYVEKILADTASHVEEVAIQQDGSYLIVEDEEEARMPAASPAADGIEADAVEGDGAATVVAAADGKKRKSQAAQNESPAQKRKNRRQRKMQANEESDDGDDVAVDFAEDGDD